MEQIEWDDLGQGIQVYYHYSLFAVDGPFEVMGFFSNHQGRHVQLRKDAQDRHVLLANDDDFGQLIFYKAT